jgi:hypothetical protein
MVYLILHKLAKLAIVLANSSLASTTKGHSLANSSLASLKDFQKRPFWRVLEFDKIGEFSVSTQIRQIRCRVAIA